MKNLLIILLILASILGFSNPNKEDFVIYINKNILKNNDKSEEDFVDKIASGIVSLAVERMTDRSNYFIFSYYEINTDLIRVFNKNIHNLKFIGVGKQFFPFPETIMVLKELEKNKSNSAESKPNDLNIFDSHSNPTTEKHNNDLPTSNKIKYDNYQDIRSQLLKNGEWIKLTKPPIANWTAPFEEIMSCDEGYCIAYFQNKLNSDLVKKYVIINCPTPYDYDNFCGDSNIERMLIVNVKNISLDEFENEYQITKAHFE